VRQVVITGIGVILPNCDSRQTLWQHLSRGESQLALEPDPAQPNEKCAAGRVNNFDPAKYLKDIPSRFYRQYPRELQLYLASIFVALGDAKLRVGQIPSEKIGFFDGAARPTFAFWHEKMRAEADSPPREVYGRRDLLAGLPGQTVGVAASLFKTRGPAFVFLGTCSSGAIAIGHAYREIRDEEIDVAIATGHECSLTAPLFAMYHHADLLSTEREDATRAVTPFVGYSTNAFGEGSVALVLESKEHALARGAEVLAEIAAFKYGNNGYHPTTVDVTGIRPTEVIRDLLQKGGVSRGEVDFVVGHGNAVQLSDVSEENYMRAVFGPKATEVPLISTKPIYGHTLGASSALNVAAAVLMLKHGFIIPTINIDESLLKRATHHQANRGVAKDCKVGLAMSYGMGGHNTGLLLKR
jgi:3-oxoacyl-[acyl-carrier-protein] synthase II